jgi:hypothetical protein
VCVCVRACVCVRERERKREGQTTEGSGTGFSSLCTTEYLTSPPPRPRYILYLPCVSLCAPVSSQQLLADRLHAMAVQKARYLLWSGPSNCKLITTVRSPACGFVKLCALNYTGVSAGVYV